MPMTHTFEKESIATATDSTIVSVKSSPGTTTELFVVVNTQEGACFIKTYPLTIIIAATAPMTHNEIIIKFVIIVVRECRVQKKQFKNTLETKN